MEPRSYAGRWEGYAPGSLLSSGWVPIAALSHALKQHVDFKNNESAHPACGFFLTPADSMLTIEVKSLWRCSDLCTTSRARSTA